jgi:hypothetical protein
VIVNHNGTFTMEGGTISGNTAVNGGGVYVGNGAGAPGTFEMTGGIIGTIGTIGRNTATSGGGVYVDLGSTLTMSDEAAISGNTATSQGGGVHSLGTFNMSGGAISGNTAANGGGVWTNNSGAVLTMSGGTISGNTASSNGGGVFVATNSNLIMSGGAISENRAANGGGVYIGTGIVKMSGGAISGNTATGSGKGVYIDNGPASAFTMSDGAVVNQNDEVYLASGKRITVGELAGSGLVAKITPADTSDGTVVLAPVTGTTLTHDRIDRFTLSENVTGKMIILNSGNGVLGPL